MTHSPDQIKFLNFLIQVIIIPHDFVFTSLYSNLPSQIRIFTAPSPLITMHDFVFTVIELLLATCQYSFHDAPRASREWNPAFVFLGLCVFT